MKATATMLACVLLCSGTSALGNDGKLSPELKGLHSSDALDVIIQYKVKPARSIATELSRKAA